MMKMKLLALLTALTVAVCSLAGCSDTSTSSATDSAAESSITEESGTADSGEAQSGTEESGAAEESKAEESEEAPAGDKMTVNMTLVLEDKTEIPYELKVTKDSNLKDALLEAGLIDEEQYVALFVSNIDGHVADFMEGVTWVVTDENGEQIMGLFDEIILSDGQNIKLVYTIVPDAD